MLSNQPLANIHFDGTVNFLDLFLPKALASSDRAKAFLWVIYHYLESDQSPNPFDAPNTRPIPGKAPYMRPLTRAEMRRENVDTPEELEWGRKMSAQRNSFLQKLVSAMESEKKSKPAAPHFVTGILFFVLCLATFRFDHRYQPHHSQSLTLIAQDRLVDIRNRLRKMVPSCTMSREKTHLCPMI